MSSLAARKSSATEEKSAFETDCLPVFERLLAPCRYKGAYGGRGGGRSHFFAENLLRVAIVAAKHGRGLRWLCAREVQKSLDQSAKRLIEDKINAFNLHADFGILENKIRTPGPDGGGLIIFNGLQDHTAASIKSLEDYDGVWVEEANLSKRSVELLTPTFRKDPSKYMPAGSELWFSWNPKQGPTHPDGWEPVDKLFRDPDSKDDPDIVSVFSTYNQNPLFPDGLRRDMVRDKRRDIDKYNHIWLGGYETNSEARVFRNWRQETFDTPPNARFFFGADWGFSVDPSVLVRCFIGYWREGQAIADIKGDTFFIDYEAYKVGCEIEHLPALFAGSDTRTPPRWPNPYRWPGIEGALKWRITADSQRPDTISYMTRRGFRIAPALKGAGSVEDGIEFMQSYDIVVHTRCKYTADELATYSWKVDKISQEVLPVLADKDNHVIDAARYALEGQRRGGLSPVDYL
jgi:phage terminase large subunit